MSDSRSMVLQALEEIRALGAVVETGPVASAADVARVEARLGFALPDEVKEFFTTIGRMAKTSGRTWSFYGIDEALAQTEVYREDFDAGRGHTPFGYYPSRYLVLYDEGDYANAACGTVYDADLEAFLATDGQRLVDRDEAFHVGYWGYVLDTLGDNQDLLREDAEEA